MIESVDLNFYFKDGNEVVLPLTPKQVEGIIKLLGLNFNANSGEVTMFSDKSLEEFMSKTINRFKEVK